MHTRLMLTIALFHRHVRRYYLAYPVIQEDSQIHLPAYSETLAVFPQQYGTNASSAAFRRRGGFVNQSVLSTAQWQVGSLDI